MKIVLFQPQIPQNTGNIVRTCAATGSDLILVPPLGFKTTSRHLKRAGLDYWEGVNVLMIPQIEEYLLQLKVPFYFFSSHATKNYTTIDYSPQDHLIFGSETSGLPKALWTRWESRFYKVPMKLDTRCLNLANTVSIVVYEGWRQCAFSWV